eukprot:s711_g3.t1
MNPGPEIWRVATANPTANHPFRSSKSLERGRLIAVTETHLTPQGLIRFKSELKGSKSKYSVIHGHPAPYRSHSIRSYGGKQVGAGFLSTFPGRPLKVGWQDEIFATSRVAAGDFCIGDRWIRGGVAYGFAQSSETPQVKQMTEELLQSLSQQVVHSSQQFAFIAGDFNQLYDSLVEPKKWEAMGWREVQQLAIERWGVTPVATCKHTSRKDFVYLSPALVQFVQSVQNSWELFADHSVLSAILAFPRSDPRQAFWPQPQPIRYTSNEEADAVHNFQTSPVDLDRPSQEVYPAIFEQFEHAVHTTKRAMGQPGLPPSQRGRGVTSQRAFRRVHEAPLKPSRQGEPEPGLDGLNLKYKRWFTQLRRMVAYHQLVVKDSTTTSALDHKFKLWRSILFAHGFGKSFSLWWMNRPNRNSHDMTFLPQTPPDSQLAKYCLDQFQIEVSALETELKSQRHEKQVQRYQHDLNQIFRDIRKPAPQPVQLLVAKETCTVQEVIDAHEVLVDQPGPVLDNKVWQSSQGTHVVTSQGDTTVKFEHPHGLVPGDVLSRQQLVGSVEDIHSEFAKEWQARWDKHLHLPTDHWQEITKFATMTLPSKPMEYRPIDLALWKKTIANKKTHTATGLDGISKQDLMTIPDTLHMSILALLHRAETAGEWPSQALQGAVHSLAKCVDAESVNQFRPVTILPLIYRCWGTIRSREILQHIASMAPSSMMGNLPNRSSPAVWWYLQSLIERCLYDGFPEGCGLSVAAMALCNLVTHTYLAYRCPRVCMISYVDNIELSSSNTEDTLEAIEVLTRFTAFMGTPVDPKKTYGWALDTKGRKCFTAANHVVHKSHADLGAHLQYSGNQTNGAVKQKCLDLKQLWPRLAQSSAPGAHKQRVLTTVAWPRALHASSTVHIAEAVVQEMRSGAMQALRMDKTGASSVLQFGLSQNTLMDPGFYMLWDAVMQFRRFATLDTESVTLDLAAWMPDRRKKPGPCGVLAARLSEVGWCHVRATQFADQESVLVDIYHCPVQELRQRLKRAWHHQVGASLAYRKEFEGLAKVDVATSTTGVPSWTPDEAGLLRALHNGTFMTQDHFKSAKQVDSDACKFCGQWQTILRAELVAVIMAVSISLTTGKPTRIWCDNQTVVQRFWKMQAGLISFRPTMPDHDLWTQLQSLILQAGDRVSIFKVASHQEDTCEDDFLNWVFAGMSSRLKVRTYRYCVEAQSVLDKQVEHAKTLTRNRRLQQELHKYFTQVGLFAVQWKEDAEDPTEEQMLGREPILPEMEVSFLRVAERASEAPSQMQFTNFHLVVSWLRHVHAAEASPVWATWYELLWSFQSFTNIRELQKVDCHSKWKQASEKLEYECAKACRSFAAFMTHLIRIAYPKMAMIPMDRPLDSELVKSRMAQDNICYVAQRQLEDGSVALYTSAQTSNNCSVLAEVTVSPGSSSLKVAIRTETQVLIPLYEALAIPVVADAMAFIVAVPIQLWDNTVGKNGTEANASAVVQACLDALGDDETQTPPADCLACVTQVLASLLHRRQQVATAIGTAGSQALLKKLHGWCMASIDFEKSAKERGYRLLHASGRAPVSPGVGEPLLAPASWYTPVMVCAHQLLSKAELVKLRDSGQALDAEIQQLWVALALDVVYAFPGLDGQLSQSCMQVLSRLCATSIGAKALVGYQINSRFPAPDRVPNGTVFALQLLLRMSRGASFQGFLQMLASLMVLVLEEGFSPPRKCRDPTAFKKAQLA